MSTRTWRQRWALAAAVAMGLAAGAPRLSAQSPHLARLPSIGGPEVIFPAVARFTLDEAKWRAQQNSKLLNLAILNIQSKGYATLSTRAD